MRDPHKEVRESACAAFTQYLASHSCSSLEDVLELLESFSLDGQPFFTRAELDRSLPHISKLVLERATFSNIVRVIGILLIVARYPAYADPDDPIHFIAT